MDKVIKTGKPTFVEKEAISPKDDGAKKKGVMDKGLFSPDKLTSSMNAAPAPNSKSGTVEKGTFAHKPNSISPA